ncbi:MAG: hypothetical protein ACJAWV_000566 [Flammeovirgaceae bacterium]
MEKSSIFLVRNRAFIGKNHQHTLRIQYPKFAGIAIATAKNFNALEGNKKQK